MKKTAVKILSALLMLSMVFSTNVFAANDETTSAWDSFLGLFSTTATTDVGVEYRGHIENKGDFPLDGTWIQGPNELGTRGQFLRMEGFWIQLTNIPDDLNIKYNVHVQNEGWLFDEDDSTLWPENGEFCGTKAKAQRIEAVKIVLVDDEGNLSTDYDVLYQGHVQDRGDLPADGSWYENGEQLGTVASSLRLEALKVKIVQKEADLTEYDAALAAVTQADYTTASWSTYEAVVDANVVDADNLQSEVDAATAAITAAQADLIEVPTVESVTAITTTTVNVTLVDVQTTIPSLDDMNVVVNATDVTPTKIVLKAGTTKTYTLTIPTLANKQGSLTVNGVAPTTKVAVGSEYDFDFQKPTATVAVVDSKTLDVTYNENVTKANAETVGNYVVRKISNNADDAAVAAATLQADGKTVRVSLTTALVPANYVLKLNTVGGATISDLAGNVLAAGTELAFTGTSDADVTKPTVVSTSYDSASGLVYINFSEKMSTATLVKSGFSITDGTNSVTLGVNETGAWNGTATQLTVTLSSTNKAAVNNLGADKELSIAADSVKDLALNGNEAVSDLALSAKTVLTSAAYDQSSNQLTLNFSNPVKLSTLILGEIKLDGSLSRTLAATDTVKTTTDGKTVIIEVKKDANLDAYEGTGVTGRNVDFSAAAGTFVDVNGVAVARTDNVALTYTADTTAPILTSANFNKTTNRLTLVFSEPVQIDNVANTYIPVAANAAFTTGAHGLAGAQCEQDTADGVATSASTVTFVDGTSTLVTTSKIYFPTVGAFKDDAGNNLAVVNQSGAIQVVYADMTGPETTAAAALTSTSATLTFDKKVDKATAENIANYNVAMTTNSSAKIPVASASLNGAGTVVTLVFGSATTQGIGYTITATNIVDTFGNPIQTGAGKNSETFTGSITTDTTGPSLNSVVPTFTDVDGSKTISAGDELVYSFDEAMNIDFTKITTADYAITGGRTFGTDPVIANGDGGNQIKITLGTTPTITWNDTLTPTGSSDFKDLAGNSAQTVASGALTNPGTAPKITTAVYADTNADGSVSAGDKVTITYDRNLSLPNGVAGVTGADFTLVGGLSFGAAPSAELANGNQIVMTVGGAGISVDAVVGTADTIDEAVSSDIADEWGTTQAGADATVATVTSADRTSPTISNVSLTKGSGNTATTLQIDDKITITLSEAVNKATFVAGDFVLYKGATAVAYNGATGDVAVSGNTITITVKGIAGGAGDDGWVGETISALTTFNFSGGVTSIEDASRNIASPSAGFGVTVTK